MWTIRWDAGETYIRGDGAGIAPVGQKNRPARRLSPVCQDFDGEP